MKKEKDLVRKGIMDLKPYIPGKPIEDVKKELGLKEVIKLASNETSVGPSPLAIKAIIKEVENIRKVFYETNSFSVLTTQKDAVKLLQFSKELDDIDIYYLKIELVFEEPEKFYQLLNKKLN